MSDEAEQKPEPTISNLAMLVARLIHAVRLHDPDNPVAEKAMDYLNRTDLQRPVLRDIMARQGLTPPEDLTVAAIVRDPEIRGGEAVIAGTRFPLSQLIAEIAQRYRSCDSLDDLCYDLELNEDAVIAALQELSTELQQSSGGA